MKIIERLAMERLLDNISKTEQCKTMSFSEIENALRHEALCVGISDETITDFIFAGDI